MGIPNNPLKGNNNLSDCVYDTIKHFHQTNKYNGIDRLFLMSGIQILSSSTE